MPANTGRTVAALVALAAACGAPAGRRPERVHATDAWARATAGPDGAAYLTLHNPTRDTAVVVGVVTPLARAASLHASVTTGHGAGATMHMSPVPRVAVPPGDSLVLAPAGRHVMLQGLVGPLAPGAQVPLVLRLAGGDSVAVSAAVRGP